ncbi:MAG: polysaccharide deacetylase family protein [Acidimicrobiales bacterium]|nr:polysaccharide deacetylase family protein [Acidimicrobiales bacterium]
MPAERRHGMDHDHYAWSALPTRPALRWPDGKQLALCVIVLLEHYEWEPPEGSYGLRRPSGGIFPLPAPDYLRLTHREYGHRVGVFRVLDALDANGVPANVAMDALTAEHYGWLGRHCVQRGCELLGHGVAASRPITSRMSEAEERATIARSVEALTRLSGAPPAGWLGPECAESARTPQLLAEAGIRYLCDWPNDEQPYAMTVADGELTALPMFLETDDEFALWTRRMSLDDWAAMVVEAATRLHDDGADSGRLLVLTLRPWLIGQPFRIGALESALRAVMSLPHIWAARGSDIVDAFRTAGR